MRKTLILAATLAACAAGEARAQTVLDMTMITCRDYLAQPAERQDLLASWMSGYFNAARNNAVLDTARFERNRKIVTTYCRRNGAELLMSAIQRNAR
jgi:acid stress chaperone HdeB